ncbi:MAG TPA: 16S rRNA (adenine(1518)-N(6)/adenine(1519)-N(6))-dimethyltransferase RsmA [Bryobacteraceae bacterium]|nr:16S rRNA (adenine(1518)-N(6)/adenine(1519)-N(6))-dimethyltransferase RsmA [Bryobacteraceae bacterium]
MARQKLGQHFLASAGTLEKIALAACGPGVDLAVEIGPGKGALTERLLAHAQRVVAFELDRELAAYLVERWADEPRLNVRQADALTVDFAKWPDERNAVLAGNLPYYAATAIISRFLRAPGDLRHGTFLIQKEVADRIAARPGTRDYGYLTVECEYLANVEYLFTVPPGAFRPPPKVNSAVVRLTPRQTGGTEESKAFLDFASACFRQKRKTLRNNLSGRYDLWELPRDPRLTKRAEELSVGELLSLFESVAAAPRTPR